MTDSSHKSGRNPAAQQCYAILCAARETLGSEAPRVHHAARRRGGRIKGKTDPSGGLFMAAQNVSRKYDRDFLLSPEKRNQIVELWEVEKYGRDCFNDPNHVHLYGMSPSEWYGRGVRILARTCLEAVKDPLGNEIGRGVAEIIARAPANRAVGVVDPFAGSCNGLYAILRHLPGSKGIGFEVEPAVFDLTTRNIAHLTAPSRHSPMVIVSRPCLTTPPTLLALADEVIE
jgi:hypothetical protein